MVRLPHSETRCRRPDFIIFSNTQKSKKGFERLPNTKDGVKETLIPLFLVYSEMGGRQASRMARRGEKNSRKLV